MKSELLKMLFSIPIATAFIHILHALTLDRRIQYVETPFRHPHITPGLEGYKIAFITDTHGISPSALSEVTERLNKENIDLLLLGGDFNNGPEESWRSIEILSRTAAADGIYSVEGNHDNRKRLQAAMNHHGITLLLNNGVRVRDNLFLAGTSCLRRRHPIAADIPQAVKNAAPGDFVLLLAHEPDITMRQSTKDVDLILCGHTHGGQITLFGLWAPALTLVKWITGYGQRFMSAWAKSRDNTPVYVSRGTGSYFIRVFARPQVVIFTLKNAK